MMNATDGAAAPHFCSKLVLEDDGGLPFVLAAPLVYVSERFGSITVPAGFKTDLASIPRPLWAVLPPIGRYDHGAVLHDLAYQSAQINGHPITRAMADALLLEAMTARGVRWTQRQTIYAGVRAGGWAPWLRYRRATLPAVAISLPR